MRSSAPSLLAAGLLTLLVADASHAAPIIADDFEVDSSADYTVVDDGAPDGTVTFAFDYVAAAIPLAPRSAAGDRSGLRMTVNDTAGALDAFTAFHDTPVGGSFTLWVDLYLGVTGGNGTTEHAHVGVGGDGNTLNTWLPTSGSGAFLAMDGDGGSGSDYRHFTEESGLVDAGDASYLAGGSDNGLGLYQSIYPATNGSPTNLWTTLRIDVVAGASVTYSLDGTTIIAATTASTAGFVSLGYADAFTSLAVPAQSQFVVFDNLEVVPEPGPTLLLLAGALFAAARARVR